MELALEVFTGAKRSGQYCGGQLLTQLVQFAERGAGDAVIQQRS